MYEWIIHTVVYKMQYYNKGTEIVVQNFSVNKDVCRGDYVD